MLSFTDGPPVISSGFPALRGNWLQSLLSDLALEPVRRPDVNPMVGEWKGYYRIRVGDMRIIFWLDTQEMTVYVDHIGPRGDVYK